VIETQITTLRPYNARYTGDNRSIFRKGHAEIITRISPDIYACSFVGDRLLVTLCHQERARSAVIGESAALTIGLTACTVALSAVGSACNRPGVAAGCHHRRLRAEMQRNGAN
jgi:hypothetical protein